MMEKRLLIYKTALLIIGSIVAAYGIMLAMGAGFGGATLAVLWQGMSVTFGMSLGMASFIVAAAMLIISLFYDRRQINAGTIVYQIIYSFFVDVFAKINVYPEQAWLRLAVMCVGIIIFAAGTGAYAAADLGKGSYEALTFSLAEKNNWPVKTVRTALDALLVVSGVHCPYSTGCFIGCFRRAAWRKVWHMYSVYCFVFGTCYSAQRRILQFDAGKSGA